MGRTVTNDKNGQVRNVVQGVEPSGAWQSERQPQDSWHENASDGSYRPLCFQGECFFMAIRRVR